MDMGRRVMSNGEVPAGFGDLRRCFLTKGWCFLNQHVIAAQRVAQQLSRSTSGDLAEVTRSRKVGA
jgi:hypothetical protein